MISWIKSLLKKYIAPEHRKEDPVVSEPVLTLARLWESDKKRFKFKSIYPDIHEIYGGVNLNLKSKTLTCDVTF